MFYPIFKYLIKNEYISTNSNINFLTVMEVVYFLKESEFQKLYD